MKPHLDTLKENMYLKPVLLFWAGFKLFQLQLSHNTHFPML
jgi:hypothetical protein